MGAPVLLAGAVLFCRVAVGLVFASSLALKVASLPTFRRTIAGFGLLPDGAERIVVPLVLAGELAVAVAMAAGGPLLVAGFGLAILLLAVYSSALASVLVRRVRASCNCFGTTARPVGAFDVWRNAGIAACAIAGAAAALAGDGRGLEPGAAALLAACAVAAVAVWVSGADIAWLVHAPRPPAAAHRRHEI